MGKTLQITVATFSIIGSVSVAQTNSIALSEMSDIAAHMDAVTFDIGYYVTPENLNDLAQSNTVRPYDSIKNQGGVFPIDPFIGTFQARRDFTVGNRTWNGPYITYQANRVQTDPAPYDQGSPLDPWDNPYYLFNPLGLLRGDQGVITQELYGDQFNRYTVVSLGPDQIKSSDDITYQFGGDVTGTHLTSISGAEVTLISAPMDVPAYKVVAGTTVTLRGLNINPPSQEKSVLFGSTVVSEVHSWNDREVVISIPAQLAGTAEFSLQLGTEKTAGITATVVGSNTGISNWNEY